MRIFIAAFFILAAGASASVAHPGGGGVVREACRGDVGKLCHGTRPGDGRIRACLKSNRDRLSDGCKSAITAAIEARLDARPPSAAQSTYPRDAATSREIKGQDLTVARGPTSRKHF